MRVKNKSKGIMAAVLIYSIWGFTLLFSTLAQRVSSPNVLLMYRFCLATVIMSIPLLLKKQKICLKNKKKFLGLFLLGLVEPIIYFPCEQFGLMYTNSSFAGIMIALIPVSTMLASTVFLKERPTKLQWFFSFLSISGVVAVTLITSSNAGTIRPFGVVLLLIAVLSGSAYGLLCRLLSDLASAYERTFVTLLMGTVFFTVCAVAETWANPMALFTPLCDTSFVIAVLYVAIFASVIGYSLLNYAIDNAPMANVMSLNNLVTLLSIISGVLFLHEPFSFGAGVSMFVVMVGIWGVQRFGEK